ncbi:unnamed protein product, partial [Rotaria sordida]
MKIEQLSSGATNPVYLHKDCKFS